MGNRLYNYAGHIKKAVSEIKTYLKKTDLVLEVRDARIPYSSENLPLRANLEQKKSILLFNKEDLESFTGIKNGKLTTKKKTPSFFDKTTKKMQLCL